MFTSPAVYCVDSSPGPRYHVDAKMTRFGRDGTPSFSMLGRMKEQSKFLPLHCEKWVSFQSMFSFIERYLKSYSQLLQTISRYRKTLVSDTCWDPVCQLLKLKIRCSSTVWFWLDGFILFSCSLFTRGALADTRTGDLQSGESRAMQRPASTPPPTRWALAHSTAAWTQYRPLTSTASLPSWALKSQISQPVQATHCWVLTAREDHLWI